MLEELIFSLKKVIPFAIFKLIFKYKIREPLFWVVTITAIIIIYVIANVLKSPKKEIQKERPKKNKKVTKELTTKQVNEYSEERILCSDGSCIGVINKKGVCNICGKPYSKEPES
jgi:uncharacterized membrane protein